jgi:hypothetical protein
MAEFMVIVVPKDPDFAPDSRAIDVVVGLMEQFFPDRDADVEYETSERPMFVTSRDAFESMRCPECGDLVERFDYDDEQRLYASSDAQREIFKMPCCGAHVEAGKIDFGDDATFARLNMWIHRPGDDNELSRQQVDALSRALGCEVKWMTGVNS